MFIPDYSNMIAEIDDLQKRGYHPVAIEVSSLSAQIIFGGQRMTLISAEQPRQGSQAGELFGLPILINDRLSFGQYRIQTKTPYQPQLREDFHK